MPGNVGALLENGDVGFYDAGSYYAHYEMELGIRRCQWGSILSSRCVLDELPAEL